MASVVVIVENGTDTILGIPANQLQGPGIYTITNGAISAFAALPVTGVVQPGTIPPAFSLYGQSPFINVKSSGAVGDGVTDDAGIINSVIANSPVGSVIFFPGNHIVGSTIQLLANRTYLAPLGFFNGFTFRQKNGANLPAVVASSDWYNNSSSCGYPLRIYNVAVDGNSANNTTSHGLALTNFNCIIEDCSFVNTPAAGILIAANTRNGSLISNGLVQTRINKCVTSATGTYGIAISDSSHGKITDGYIVECQVDVATLDGISMDTAGGWRIERNHVNSPQQNGINATHCFNTFIRGNYIDGFGFNSGASPGTFYNGIGVQALSGGQIIVSDNTVKTSAVVANTTYEFLSVQATDNTGPNFATVHGNKSIGANVTNQNAFAYDGHLIGQSFTVYEWNNSAYNFPAANVYSINTNVTFGTQQSQNPIQTLGSFATNIVIKTGAYTLTATDSTVLCNATTAAFTVTLPTAVGIAGRRYAIKKTDSSANVVTVGTTSSQTIDGATTKALSTQYASIDIVSDGANWNII